MSRHQSPIEAYGKPAAEPSAVQVAVCPTCKTALDFEYDAIGRLRERCSTCRGRRTRPNPAKPQVSQAALTNVVTTAVSNAQLLPPVAPGQLRCQRCAKGVEGDRRFCDGCRNIGIRARMASPEVRAKMAESARAACARGRVYAEKLCPCGMLYIPTGPRHKYHAADCPARRAA